MSLGNPSGLTRRASFGLAAGVAGASLVTGDASAQQAPDEPQREKIRLLQGPMVGAVHSDRALIWIRCGTEFEAQCEFADNPEFNNLRRSAVVTTAADRDFTAVLALANLQPATRYFYRLLLDGDRDRYRREIDPAAQSFQTQAATGTKVRFRLAFGSCAKYALDPVQDIWRVIDDHRPDMFAWLGDNIYADSLIPDIYAEEYRRQRDVVGLQPLLNKIPQLAIWDDHDYGSNNDDHRNPMKEETLRIFQNYWANSAFGLADTPGIFFSYSFGGVDFFFLDGRYYRDPNSAPDRRGKSMLGDNQLAWLKDELRRSRAPFKMLVSGGGWTAARGPGGDAWSAFLSERDSLFDFIRDEGIGGVVLMSGDSHVGELNAIPWSARGGYDLYDFVASPLAQDTGASWLRRRPELRIRQVYFGGPNFGLVDFDLTKDDPILTFNIVNFRGQLAWEPFTMRASQLANGVKSWPEQMDFLSSQRYESLQSGADYYAP